MLVTAIPLLIASVFAAADPPVARPMFQPAIAPDRPEMVFVSGGDLWTAPLAGGEGRLLVSHPATESRPHQHSSRAGGGRHADACRRRALRVGVLGRARAEG